MTKLAIGIDIGGTNSKFGITDQEGNILIRYLIKNYLYYPVFIKTIKEKIEKLYSLENVIGIGVDTPNANYYKGTIEYPLIFHEKVFLSLQSKLKKYLRLNVS